MICPFCVFLCFGVWAWVEHANEIKTGRQSQLAFVRGSLLTFCKNIGTSEFGPLLEYGLLGSCHRTNYY